MNQQLRTIVSAMLGMEEEHVEPHLTRETADAWDSLNHLRLITAIEETFGINLSMAEIESIDSVARLDELVEARVPGRIRSPASASTV